MMRTLRVVAPLLALAIVLGSNAAQELRVHSVAKQGSRSLLQSQDAAESIGDAISGLIEDFANTIADVVDVFDGSNNTASDDIREGAKEAADSVEEIAQGLQEGAEQLLSTLESVSSAGLDVFDYAIDWASEFLRDAVNVTRADLEGVGDLLASPITQMLNGAALLSSGWSLLDGLNADGGLLQGLGKDANNALTELLMQVDASATGLAASASAQFPGLGLAPWNSTLGDVKLSLQQVQGGSDNAAQQALLAIGRGVASVANASRAVERNAALNLGPLVGSLFTQVGGPSDIVMGAVGGLSDSAGQFVGNLVQLFKDNNVFESVAGRRRLLADEACKDIDWDFVADVSEWGSGIGDLLECGLDSLLGSIARLWDSIKDPLEQLTRELQDVFDGLTGSRCVFAERNSNSTAALAALLNATAALPLKSCAVYGCNGCARVLGSDLVLADCNPLQAASSSFKLEPVASPAIDSWASDGSTGSDVFRVRTHGGDDEAEEGSSMCLEAEEEGSTLKFVECSSSGAGDQARQQWRLRQLDSVFQQPRYVMESGAAPGQCATARSGGSGGEGEEEGAGASGSASGFELRECDCSSRQAWAIGSSGAVGAIVGALVA